MVERRTCARGQLIWSRAMVTIADSTLGFFGVNSLAIVSLNSDR